MSRLEKINKTKLVYERTREEREPTRHPGIIIFIIILLFGGLGYLMFLSGIFNIKSLEIVGSSDQDKIRNIAVGQVEGNPLSRNLIFFRESVLEDSIESDRSIVDAEVTKVYPDKITIEVRESVSVISWNTMGENYVVDERGYIIEKIDNAELPAVYDNADIPVALGERVASPTFIKFIIDLSRDFKPITGHEIARITIFDIFSDIHVSSKSGWTVYMNSSKDPISQLNNLARVLKQAKKAGHTRLKYIDMRLEDKVYYK